MTNEPKFDVHELPLPVVHRDFTFDIAAIKEAQKSSKLNELWQKIKRKLEKPEKEELT